MKLVGVLLFLLPAQVLGTGVLSSHLRTLLFREPSNLCAYIASFQGALWHKHLWTYARRSRRRLSREVCAPNRTLRKRRLS